MYIRNSLKVLEKSIANTSTNTLQKISLPRIITISAQIILVLHESSCANRPISRGVVVPEHGGAPFRQIFLSRNGAPANIVYHRRNADTAAFWQISSGRGPIYYDLPEC